MNNVWKREPAMILGLLQTGIALAVTFGLKLSSEQVGAITAFSGAMIAMVTRTQVSPKGDQDQ